MKLTLPHFSSFVFAVSILLFAVFAQAAEPVSQSRFGSVAIEGHDTVAYHALSKEPHAAAIEGDKRFEVKYKGAKWRFATQEQADQFAASPEQYAPAYNGFCANALSLGEGLIKTDGTHWEIFDNKLYLFYAGRGRERWLDGQWEQYKAEADVAWEALRQ